MKRDVGAELDVEITAPTTLEFQIAVAPQPGAAVTESLSFILNGKEIPAATFRRSPASTATGSTSSRPPRWGT